MLTSEEQTGSKFVVDLGDLKLSDIQEKRIEAEIRAVVLEVLAETDLGGSRRLSDLVIGQFPDRTLGLVLQPGDGWPSPWPQPDQPLIVGDHTLIVRAVMEHPFHVIRYMDKAARTSNPDPKDVLEAALQVEQIDAYTKDRIRQVLRVLPQLEREQRNLPESFKRAIEGMRRQTTATRSISGRVETLRSLKEEYRQQRNLGEDTRNALQEGMEYAARILEDGRSTIYSPEFSFYRLLEEGGEASRRDALDTIADSDKVGAAVGGGVGVFVAGIGAAAGAAAGGGGASVGAAIGTAIAWLLE